MSDIKKIYLLMGTFCDNGDTVVLAYASRAVADAECAKLNVHKSTEPKIFRTEDMSKIENWRQGLTGMGNFDGYYVQEQELLP